ncbi:TPA: DUF4179 domain-containing protein [Bacillus pseudomycoides]|nr:DUF4179 domain-containing protein [Bacillus pseudomycoides]
MNLNFEKQLGESLNEDILIPKSVIEKKELAFEQIRNSKKTKKRFSYKKQIAAVITGLSIAGLALYGETPMAMIKEIFLTKDRGVQKAADNGYMQQVEKNNSMKDSGVTIQVKDIAYDKSKIVFSLRYKFDDKSVLQKVSELNMVYDLTDNKGRYIEKADTTTGLTKENGEILANGEQSIQVDAEHGELTGNFVLYPMNPITDIESLNFNIQSIQLFTPLENQDPTFMTQAETKSNIEKENIFAFHKNGMQLNKEILGKWENSITVDNKFNKIHDIKYVPQQKLESLKISSAELLPTGMNITFEFDFVEDVEKRKQLLKTIDSITLVDHKGKAHQSTRKGYSKTLNNGKSIKVKTFDITSFDEVGDFKVILKDENGKDVEINLKKE